jgi:hypothetical protein
MCSGKLANLPARPVRSCRGGYGRTSQLPTSLWIFTRFGRKVAGSKSTGLFPELTLKELVSCTVNITLSFCCNRKLVPYEIQL